MLFHFVTNKFFPTTNRFRDISKKTSLLHFYFRSVYLKHIPKEKNVLLSFFVYNLFADIKKTIKLEYENKKY